MEKRSDLGIYESSMGDTLSFGCYSGGNRTAVVAVDREVAYYVTLYRDGDGYSHQVKEREIGIIHTSFNDVMVSVLRWLYQGMK